MAIADYFKGEYTMFEICKKYDILDRGILKGWIRKYNWNNKIKSHNNKGDRIMTGVCQESCRINFSKKLY